MFDGGAGRRVEAHQAGPAFARVMVGNGPLVSRTSPSKIRSRRVVESGLQPIMDCAVSAKIPAVWNPELTGRRCGLPAHAFCSLRMFGIPFRE